LLVGSPDAGTNDESAHIFFHSPDIKNTEETVVIKHCVSVDELEQMMADKKIDWENWEIVPVEGDYCEQDGSF
jgi:hypothetical protein